MQRDSKENKKHEGMKGAYNRDITNYFQNPKPTGQGGMGGLMGNFGGLMGRSGGSGNKGLSGLEFKELENQYAFEMAGETKIGLIDQLIKDKNTQILKKDPKFFNNFEDDFDDDDLN